MQLNTQTAPSRDNPQQVVRKGRHVPKWGCPTENHTFEPLTPPPPPHGEFSKLGSLFWGPYCTGAVLFWGPKQGP